MCIKLPLTTSALWQVCIGTYTTCIHVRLWLLAAEKDNVIFATTRHGGHLGYFEGGLLFPRSITWLDKVVVQYTNAVVRVAVTSTHRDDDAAQQDDSVPQMTS